MRYHEQAVLTFYMAKVPAILTQASHHRKGDFHWCVSAWTDGGCHDLQNPQLSPNRQACNF